MIRPLRALTASAFVRRTLAAKTPPDFFWVEGESPDPRLLPGEELQFMTFAMRTGFMQVPERPRPLQILGEDGKQWIYFRYFRRTKRVPAPNLVSQIARALDAIAVHGQSYWEREAGR